TTTTTITATMTRKRRKKTRSKETRTNENTPGKTYLSAVAGLLLGIALLAPAQTRKATKKEIPHAVVAGTVFRDPGFAQPGATVTVSKKDAPGKKLDQAVSDARGEFAFRLPPGPVTYVVTATLKGFKPDRLEFPVEGEEQVNATLLLVPESKK